MSPSVVDEAGGALIPYSWRLVTALIGSAVNECTTDYKSMVDTAVDKFEGLHGVFNNALQRWSPRVGYGRGGVCGLWQQP